MMPRPTSTSPIPGGQVLVPRVAGRARCLLKSQIRLPGHPVKSVQQAPVVFDHLERR